MSRKDIQWKNYNNNVAVDGFIRGAINQDDCPNANDEFYVCTIPAGVVLKGVTAWIEEAEEPDKTVDIKINIGTNECQLCEEFEVKGINGKKAICVDGCKCLVTKEQVPVLVKLSDKIETGNLNVYFEVLRPYTFNCAVDAVVPDTMEVVLDHCQKDSCSDC